MTDTFKRGLVRKHYEIFQAENPEFNLQDWDDSVESIEISINAMKEYGKGYDVLLQDIQAVIAKYHRATGETGIGQDIIELIKEFLLIRGLVE